MQVPPREAYSEGVHNSIRTQSTKINRSHTSAANLNQLRKFSGIEERKKIVKKSLKCKPVIEAGSTVLSFS